MKLERYKEYKDSKVSWLGQVPASWEVRRNKNVFYEASQLSEDGSETLLTVSHITGVTPRSEKNVNMFMAETMQGYKVCKVGDLVINTMWAWMGALGVVRHHGICSPAYGVYRPIKGVSYLPRYFDYLFRTPNFVTEMTRSSKGIVSSRLRLYPKDFYQLQTVVPSIKEQQAIVNYLDKRVLAFDKTALILERKISTFLELKKTLILEAICRGLKATAPRKPSGVAWLGDIPTHWNVRRLKDDDEVIMGQSPESKDYSFDEDGFPFLQGNAEFGAYHPTAAVWCHSASKVVRPNDVLVSVRAPIGAVNVADRPYGIGRGLCAVRSKKSDYRFLYYHFLARKEDLNSMGTGTTYIAISLSGIRDLPMAYPPIQEQVEIAAYLDQKAQKIDSIVTNLKAQIDTLKELRKTLINEVATGKLKVTE